MASIEKNKKGKNIYLSFVKKLTFMGKKFVYKEHIGKGTSAITKEKHLLENLDKITKEELNFKLGFLNYYILIKLTNYCCIWIKFNKAIK